VSPTAELELQPADRAPAEARAFIRDIAARRHLPSELVGDVLLAASELVTNAVEHVRQPLRLRILVDPSKIRIEVHDPDPRAPAMRTGGPEELGGRGLRLVDAVADRWGVTRAHDGKVVFAEFRC
jgi:anti-sigma regulatory factor (Ser/Thr protein kinase)